MAAKYRCPLYNEKIITSYKSCTIVGNNDACNSGKRILNMFNDSSGRCMCTHIKLKGDDALVDWKNDYKVCIRDTKGELKKKYPFPTEKAL